MTPELQKLLDIMQWNRQKHGKIWRKVRIDRLYKLFDLDMGDIPHFLHTFIDTLIEEGMASGKLELCQIMTDHGLVPSIKLRQFEYKSPYLLTKPHP